MKKLLFSNLLFPLLLHAQFVENDNFRADFSSFAQGMIVVSVKNKAADCTVEIRAKWDGKDTTLLLSPAELRQVFLPFSGGNVEVQLKTVTACNKQKNGPWLKLSLVALPIRDNRMAPPARPVPADSVIVVRIMDGWHKKMAETDFQRQRINFRYHFFILRQGRTKEVVL